MKRIINRKHFRMDAKTATAVLSGLLLGTLFTCFSDMRAAWLIAILWYASALGWSLQPYWLNKRRITELSISPDAITTHRGSGSGFSIAAHEFESVQQGEDEVRFYSIHNEERLCHTLKKERAGQVLHHFPNKIPTNHSCDDSYIAMKSTPLLSRKRAWP